MNGEKLEICSGDEVFTTPEYKLLRNATLAYIKELDEWNRWAREAPPYSRSLKPHNYDKVRSRLLSVIATGRDPDRKSG